MAGARLISQAFHVFQRDFQRFQVGADERVAEMHDFNDPFLAMTTLSRYGDTQMVIGSVTHDDVPNREQRRRLRGACAARPLCAWHA